MKSNILKLIKFFLAILLLFIAKIINAQNFTEVMNTPFVGVAASAVAFADIDGDNDQDLLITGATLNDRITKLYTNDGLGNFTEVINTPFQGVAFSAIAFADVDNDNDLDVLITGSSLFNFYSKLYLNDGSGNFTEMPNTPFEPLNNGSIAFADVDGDGDQDVLMSGQNLSITNHISKLYLNNGSGSFTEALNTPFIGTIYSSIAFADVDGDNDKDVLITGQNNSGGFIAKLYTNDGSGNFTEVSGTPFDGVSDGAVAFADVDGDGDQDVLITGSFSSKLYKNKGLGVFTLVVGTPFSGVDQSSIAFADVDGDNNLDVLITGTDASFTRSAKLYANDGAGNYTEVSGTPFAGVDESSIAFSDIDGDNDLDVLITGLGNGSLGHISKLYLNNELLSSTDYQLTNNNLKITAFPNPATSDNLNIKFTSTEKEYISLNVFNLSGQIVHQQRAFVNIGNQILKVDISALNSGTYFIQLESDNYSGVTKFIVQ